MWYMHNLESILEIEILKVLMNFEIQTNHLILARQPDRVIDNKKKKNSQMVDLAIQRDH